MANETHDAATLAANAAHGAAPAADHAAQSAGMPQLDVTTFGNQIFWLLVSLVVIYWVLSRIALPRIGAVLADRQSTIVGDLNAADELKAKAKAAEVAYEKALTDARSQAQEIVGKAKAEIQKDLDLAIAKADAEIAARTAESESRIDEIRAGAAEAVEVVAKDTAAELVAVLGGKADAATLAAAVSARLKG
ncbi:F0F1 ATP synthase subunit B' [Albirhodobacter sp. R86504]|uniref:F0F1 ATP synthase subunit B' n=1 Tax=Albirhodobacter sp. R86504 TaxID=3093848 RepID=UPI0036735983